MPDMMGCIGSHLTRVMSSISESRHSRSSRRNQNIFPVLNVDDLGRHLAPGKLEVTETDLVLRIPGKAPLTWPLRCLRRYGYENDLFSFESGRRCPTGAGIYAFKCHRAQVIFNLLQAKIQVGNLNITLPPTVPNQMTNGAADNLNDDMTPVSISPTFDYVNISDGQHHQPRVLHNQTDKEPDSPQSSLHQENGSNPTTHPLYMNVESQKKSLPMANYQNQPRKCNGHRKLLEGLTPSVPLLYKNDLNFNTNPGGVASGSASESGSIYYTNVVCTRKFSITATSPEVNYAELDLEQAGKLPRYSGEPHYSTPQHKASKETFKPGLKSSKSVGFASTNNQSPPPTAELGYATIDFDRTAALSGVTRTKIKLDFHSPSMDKEEGGDNNLGYSSASGGGVRKTRHNSTAL